MDSLFKQKVITTVHGNTYETSTITKNEGLKKAISAKLESQEGKKEVYN